MMIPKEIITLIIKYLNKQDIRNMLSIFNDNQINKKKEY